VLKPAASNLLLVLFLTLGSGSLQYLHNLQHLADDARLDALRRAQGTPTERHHHDEGNCATHAVLFFAFFFEGWTTYVFCIGLLIAFLILLQTRTAAQSLPLRIDCRGPPVIA
jgi:hypothetical protein